MRLDLKTYIFPDNRAKARTPQNALPTDLIHEQSLAAEHGLAETLALILGHNALRARQEGVFADAPLLVSTQLDDGDVADGGRRQEQLAGPRVRRLGHVAADEGFFERELHGAFEGYGRGHGDHGAWGVVSIGFFLNAILLVRYQNSPGFAVNGHPIANCTVKMVFVSRWLTL